MKTIVCYVLSLAILFGGLGALTYQELAENRVTAKQEQKNNKNDGDKNNKNDKEKEKGKAEQQK